MYCFQESLPDSLPPPVSFSPPKDKKTRFLPKAPPISAPLVGILTLTIPQSDPASLFYKYNHSYPTHLKTLFTLLVNKLLLSPCFTLLLYKIASSRD
jgi:hypothetical protein